MAALVPAAAGLRLRGAYHCLPGGKVGAVQGLLARYHREEGAPGSRGGISYPASVGPGRASTRRMASSQALVILARPGRALPVSLTGAADCAGDGGGGGGGFLSVYTSVFTP